MLCKAPDGSHILVDLKISQPYDSKIDKYKTQLGAYRFALENPSKGGPIKISKMALLVMYPDTVEFRENNLYSTFPPKWLEIPDDQYAFFKLMKDIDLLLASPAPAESETCKWCQYRHTGEQFSHIIKPNA